MSFQRPAFWRIPKNKPEPVNIFPVKEGKTVGYNSPVSNTLQRGDVIKKIGNYDARDIRHQDAQNLFKNAGCNIKVVVQREPNRHNTSTASSRCSSHTPMSNVSPALSPRGPAGPGGLPTSTHLHHPQSAPASEPISPQPYSLPTTPTPYQSPDSFTPMTEGSYKEIYPGITNKPKFDDDIENVLNQPYRTTPLVLPGAKVKRESGPTESYLKHHPNPTVRAPPHQLDSEHLMKQRVADSVIQKVVTENQSNLQIAHKQFNSPIHLYTEQNIVDTIKNQSGITTPNGTYIPKGKCISKKYDPCLSETYKAIQEEENDMQDVSPIQPKVFTPPGPRTPQPRTQKQIIHHPPPYDIPHHHHNSLGAHSDTIQQSGSFKRLMYHVNMMADN